MYMYDRTLQLDLSVVFGQARKNLAELGRERENLADLVPLAMTKLFPDPPGPDPDFTTLLTYYCLERLDLKGERRLREETYM